MRYIYIYIYIVIFNSQLPTFNDAWKYEMKTTETRGTVSSTELTFKIGIWGEQTCLEDVASQRNWSAILNFYPPNTLMYINFLL